jgi:hypothetical protein
MSSHRGLNQPDKLSWNSTQDPQRALTADSNQFNIPLTTPLLDVKEVQLVRATIPQASLQIPDYQLVFWYYRVPLVNSTPGPATLSAVRLYPSNFPASADLSDPEVVMRPLTGGLTDLVALLNAAAAPTGDNVARNPYFRGAAAADVSFTLTNGQIFMKGLTAANFYCIAGWNDPNVLAAQALKNITMDPDPANPGGSIIPQPQVQGFTLNQRLGYALSGTCIQPYRSSQSVSLLVANTTGLPYGTNVDIVPDAYANIAGTSVVNVYGSFSGPSGNTTGNRKNLFCVVPMNGVLANNNYSTAMKAFLTGVPSEIYAIDIELRDENDQPYPLPDNANVNLEMLFKYRRDKFSTSISRPA